ncbi:ORF17-anti70aa [Fowl aviadenovirus 4]|nr:ORF17-anti70aa [Fowl aviadenovirus 4]
MTFAHGKLLQPEHVLQRTAFGTVLLNKFSPYELQSAMNISENLRPLTPFRNCRSEHKTRTTVFHPKTDPV